MITKILLSDIGKVLYNSLDNIEEWNFNHSKFTIEHKPTSMKLWVGGGWLMFGNCEPGNALTICDRFLIWDKYVKARTKFINNKIGVYREYRRNKAMC